MFGATCDGRIVVTDTTLRIHSVLPRWANCKLRFVSRASKDVSVRLHARWIGEDDAGAGAPSRRRSTARGRAVSIANALRTTRSSYRRARITRLAIQTIVTIAITHGARNAIATPIMRKLHMIAPALCAMVRRSVASGPLWCETMLPWL